MDAEFAVHELVGIATDETINAMARVRALELIGKNLGIFVDRREERHHLVIERRTPSLNPAPLTPDLAERLSSARDAIAIEAESGREPRSTPGARRG